MAGAGRVGGRRCSSLRQRPPPPAGASVRGEGRRAGREGVCCVRRSGLASPAPRRAAGGSLSSGCLQHLRPPPRPLVLAGGGSARVGVITIHCQEGKKLESSSGEQQCWAVTSGNAKPTSPSSATTASSLTRITSETTSPSAPCLGQRFHF